MKRLFRYVAILLLSGALLSPAAEARGRNDRGREQPQHSQPQSRPGNNGRPSHGNGGQQHNNRPAPQQRPGNGHHGQERPGNNRPGNNRPGNQRPGNNRPNNPRPDNYRPGNIGPSFGHGPGAGHHVPQHRPDYRPPRPPQVHHHHGYNRPMPPHHGWFRPVPPPRWHAPRHWRPFSTILGIALGTTVNLSVNALINSGYTVNAYNNNTVFVNNVPMLNLMWPDALLFYNDMGGLCGSRFMYTTGYYDTSRYNTVYGSLVRAYGPPVSLQNTAAGMEATWWGTGNQFIRLSFVSQSNGYSAPNYLTTLSFGN